MTLAEVMWRLWWLAAKLRLYWAIERWQCGGYLPVDCWIPHNRLGSQGGYYRSGILANHCVLVRGHREECLGMLSLSGERVRGGFRYTPYKQEA